MTIAAEWRSNFGHVPPVGYYLRDAFPTRWLRIHSLPESRRYPKSWADWELLKGRHNTMATEVLGNPSACVLFLHYYDSPIDLDSFEWSRDIALLEVPELRQASPQDPDVEVSILAAEVEWEPGRFDSLIADVAEERASSVVVFSRASHQIYAPYDGGADLVVNSPAQVTALRSRWASWLTDLPTGL